MTEQATILIVEDSIELAESLEDILTLQGMKVIKTRLGYKAIDLALTQHPNLILLDIRLPDTDGYQVYKTIRESTWGKTAKILVITASESIETIANNIDLPLAHIFFKPNTSLSLICNSVKARLLES